MRPKQARILLLSAAANLVLAVVLASVSKVPEIIPILLAVAGFIELAIGTGYFVMNPVRRKA